MTVQDREIPKEAFDYLDRRGCSAGIRGIMHDSISSRKHLRLNLTKLEIVIRKRG